MGWRYLLAAHAEAGRDPKKMIEAVVDFIDYGDPPPPELPIAFKVDQWGTLPDAGGLYDQDAGLLGRMTVYLNIYRAVSKLRSAQGEEIHRLTDGDRRIIGELRRSGVL